MNRAEFERLIRAHQAEVYRYLRYLGAARDAAEDLAQETFMAALRSGGGTDIEDERGRAAWLRGVARNVFLMECRRNRTGKVRFDSRLVEQAESVWSSEFLRAGDGFDYVEALRKCLETLSEGQRRALDARYAEGKSRAEMARLLEMTENGVKSLLRRIRIGLAECVERRLAREEAGCL